MTMGKPKLAMLEYSSSIFTTLPYLWAKPFYISNTLVDTVTNLAVLAFARSRFPERKIFSLIISSMAWETSIS